MCAFIVFHEKINRHPFRPELAESISISIMRHVEKDAAGELRLIQSQGLARMANLTRFESKGRDATF